MEKQNDMFQNRSKQKSCLEEVAPKDFDELIAAIST